MNDDSLHPALFGHNAPPPTPPPPPAKPRATDVLQTIIELLDGVKVADRMRIGAWLDHRYGAHWDTPPHD